MTHGTMHTLDGTLVASISQETLLRPDLTGAGPAFRADRRERPPAPSRSIR